jgi:hypothetical protein
MANTDNLIGFINDSENAMILLDIINKRMSKLAMEQLQIHIDTTVDIGELFKLRARINDRKSHLNSDTNTVKPEEPEELEKPEEPETLRSKLFVSNEDDENDEDKFYKCCINGDLDSAKCLYYDKIDTNKKYIRRRPNNKIFAEACISGHLLIAVWLYKLGDNINIYANNAEVFELSCGNGHLEVARWLDSLGNMWQYFADYRRIFCLCCIKGYQEIAEWLYENNKKNIGLDITIFINICNSGQLQVAQWIWSKLSFDKILYPAQSCFSTKRGVIHEAFRKSCSSGFLDMAKWLYSLDHNILGYGYLSHEHLCKRDVVRNCKDNMELSMWLDSLQGWIS